MQQDHPTLETILKLVEHLSPDDKRRLIEHIEPHVTREAPAARRPTKSMEGILADLGPAPSEEDIREIRKEMWKNFPREDI